MRVHHLNCGTMTPPGLRLVCHVLLIEGPTGLTLVDSGYGLRDIADPSTRVGPSRWMTRPVLREEETAARQVERLGFSRDDVRHVVVTHFDVDHIGGLADFPDARVHLSVDEAAGAVHGPTRRERLRYSAEQWDHGPHLVEHAATGEAWRGFAAAREIPEAGVVMVALPGHTRGHVAVAVDAGERGWLLHAGDAFYHRGVIDGSSPTPRALAVMESSIAWDRAQVRDNHARLAELHQRGEPDLAVFCAHDPVQLEQLAAQGS